MATKTEKHVSELSNELKRLLAENSNLIQDTIKGKIKCSLSGHEMPVREDAVRAYLGGKKFKKVQAVHFNYEQYQPHIVPSTKKFHEHQLLCTLTLRHINKTPTDVERHVSGGKFKRARARWEECQKNGTVFKPNRGRRHKAGEFETLKGDKAKKDPVEEEEKDSDTDSLSDLYPAIDFSIEDDEPETSDYDMNAMEVDQTTSTENTDQSRDKRKSEKHVVKQVKQKHKKQRVG